MRPTLIFTLTLLTLCLHSITSIAAIGIFNHQLQLTDNTLPATIQYRLNSPGTVTIEIIDDSNSVVHTLGPYSETAGLHLHQWQGEGISGQSHSYRARIGATAPQTGIPGTLTRLAGENTIGYIYGLAVDKCPTSPGYGTIYVSRTIPGGAIRAFHADGTPKNDFGPDPNTNILNLGFESTSNTSPWGIGVDDQGNIYTACRSTGSSVGIKVFDYRGNQLYHVFPVEPQGIFWLAGTATGAQPEIFETTGQIIRRAGVSSQSWTELARFPTGVTAKQLAFQPGGEVFYVAASGNNSMAPNRGVWRFTKQPDGSWLIDAGFDTGLSGLVAENNQLASWYATGVSCDGLDPDGPGPLTCSRLWIGLDTGSAYFGGNIMRKTLPNGALDRFNSPGKVARIVAADGVGNIALEYDIVDSTGIWSNWGLYAPAGEASSDTRTTAAVTLSGTQTAVQIDSLAGVRNLADGVLIELTTAKTVTAVFTDCCYIGETDRSCGIKITGLANISEGTAVKIKGALTTQNGEKQISNAEIIP